MIPFKANPRIFVSYRRDDSADVAGRIYDKLVAEFGRDAIFKDVDSIEPGEDFREVIGDAVRRCRILLVVIGKQWLSAADDKGKRRLENANDFVRIEVESGLGEPEIRCIPVLVQNTRMPGEGDLPPSLQPLAFRNARLVRPDPDFHDDMGKLCKVLGTLLESKPTSAANTVAPAEQRPIRPPREIRIVAHSNLFFWWPVWLVGFVLAFVTYLQGDRLAIVPEGVIVESNRPDEFTLKLPMGVSPVSMDEAAKNSKKGDDAFPMHIAHGRNLGVLYMAVVLVVIFVTTVRLRGLWSVILIVVLLLITIVFALGNWWGAVLDTLSGLSIYVNLQGYLFVSSVLFVAWVATTFFYDRQVYAVFTPTSVRVCTELGGEEVTFDTTGMTIALNRDDFFRHWQLGFGSGDFVIRTSGADGREFVLPNVLFIAAKKLAIENMYAERPVALGI